ncbi:MAG TPA: hypothetical protein VH280_18535 [Verrucomicrobiae bacterium]|jgi:hypothetical protein|nr:hypothetical protein [Verrucomicrobiae bacterium]
MNTNELIRRLESEWDVDGFLWNVRQGYFSPDDGQKFLSFLKQIEIDDNAEIPKRLLSLLWYMPSFLEWQKERVGERSGNRAAYERFVTEVFNTLEIVLGVP